jgi:hypothetical protein
LATNIPDKKNTNNRTVDELVALCLMARGKPGFEAIRIKIDMSYSWVVNFAAGRVPDPSVSQVERLNKFFDELEAENAAKKLTEKI